jgi:hypothetical protein
MFFCWQQVGELCVNCAWFPTSSEFSPVSSGFDSVFRFFSTTALITPQHSLAVWIVLFFAVLEHGAANAITRTSGPRGCATTQGHMRTYGARAALLHPWQFALEFASVTARAVLWPG